MAAVLLLCLSSTCHAQQYPWNRDHGLNVLTSPSGSVTVESERRHRLIEHRKLVKIAAEGDELQEQNERVLNRRDDAWAELSKEEKKKVIEKEKRNASKKDDTSSSKRDDKKTNKKGDKSSSKKDSSKRKKDEKDKVNNGRDKYYESLTKKEKKEWLAKEGEKEGWMGDGHRHDGEEDEVCICEDDEDHEHRSLGDQLVWSDVVEEGFSDAEEWNYEKVMAHEIERQQQHSMGRSLFDLFGILETNRSVKVQAAGNMTTVSAKRNTNKGSDKKKSNKWDHDGHDDDDRHSLRERGSKSSKSGRRKKSKSKGAKSEKHSSGSKSKSSRKSNKYIIGGKSSKKVISAKSSKKPCKCRPLTRRPTQKPNKTSRPTRRPTILTKKPQHNIAPKPTTKKPVRTLRPTDKPVRTSRPTDKPAKTSRPTFKILSNKPVRTPRPSRRPTIVTSKPVRTSKPSRRPTIITRKPVRTSRPSGKPTMKPSKRPTVSTLKPVRTSRPTPADPTRKPTRRPTVKPSPKPTLPSTLTWWYWGAEEGIGGPPGDDIFVPESGFGDDVFCPAAGPRYTLLINGDGDAYAAGFIESKFEYLGHFGIDPNKLSEGSNSWKRIDRVNIDGRERNAPAFAEVYTGATGSANSGEMHSLLIDQRGQVYTTGNNNRGQLCLGDTEARFIPHKVTFDDNVKSPAVAAALGEDFTLILLENGKVYGCGSNEKGELGLGSDVKSVATPNNDNGLSDISSISAGLNFALFQAKNTKVYATGSNIYMQQCKDTGGIPTTTPKEITAFTKKIKAVEAGSESSYFLFLDGTVASCGRNDEGQLGDGSFVDSNNTDVIIPDDDKIVGLGSGPSSQSAFFIGEKAVYGTGANDRNQLGIGEPKKTELPTIVNFEESLDIVDISSSGTHTVACNLNILTDAPTISPSLPPEVDPTPEPTAAPTATCEWLYWGANEGRGGELGTNQETPLLVDEDTTDVSTGPRYTLLINGDGDAYATGFIESKFEYRGHFGVDPGKLSEGSNKKEAVNEVNVDGDVINSPLFSQVYTGATGSANSGEMHSLLIDKEGQVYTTGNNNRGQLCLGDTEARFIPHRVRLPRRAVAAALGEDFTLILLENGKVYGCGSNEKGELGLGSDVVLSKLPNSSNGLSDISNISSGLNFALFLSTAGRAYSTGSNIYMQQCEDSDSDPTVTPKMIQALRNENVVSIKAGRESSYFLLKNGGVRACGRNDEGQLGDGSFVDNEFVNVDIPEDIAITSIGAGPSSQSAFFFGKYAVFGAGANDRFQLGIGKEGSQKFPVEIDFEDLSSVAGLEKISSSGTQTVALNCPAPTPKPTAKPTPSPTNKPTNKPTSEVTPIPTAEPSEKPTRKPTNSPTTSPVIGPTSPAPATAPPTKSPSSKPTNSPTTSPVIGPTSPAPATAPPTKSPTLKPTNSPTTSPVIGPTSPAPVTTAPTNIPSTSPSAAPSSPPVASSNAPTESSTPAPVTPSPTQSPTNSPTVCIEVPETNNTIRFEAFDPLEDVQLGFSVSVFNKTVIAGAPNALSSSAIFAGAAYIYNFNYETMLWEYVQKITTPASITGDQVGFSTSMRGKFVVLGSPFASQFGNNTGYIYVYERGGEDGDTFTQLASIFGPNFTPNSNFGWAVSTNRNGTIAVGAPGDRSNVGSVYIFKTRTFSQWTLVATIEPTDVAASPSTYGNFGWSVAINEDNTVFVGAPFDESGGSKSGSVSVYKEVSEDNWELFGNKITPENGNDGDQFGVSLDIDDSSTFVIGSNRASVNGKSSAGAAYLYSFSEEDIDFIQKIVSENPSSSQLFGQSVSIEQGRLAIGAPNPGGIGTVYLYYNSTATNWLFSEAVGPVDVEDGITGEEIKYGYSVGVSLDALAVGAPENDLAADDSGSVYIYDVIVDSCNPETLSPTARPSTSDPQNDEEGGQSEELL